MYAFLHYRVRDYMTAHPVTISPNATLADAQGLFELHGFNGLPVVEGGDELLGVITKLDVLRAFALGPAHMIPPYREAMNAAVETVMTREPVTASPDLPLTRVLQRLIELRVKSLPVTEDGKLVGIISREDTLRALREAAG